MATFTNQAKNAASISNMSKSAVSTFTNTAKTLINDFLLLENGSYFLLETGDKLILEQSVLHANWSNVAKS